jgi:G3E family GTPase
MLIHLVGGFLGSGKTTAIVEACRLLMQRGITVGVVTNDQGRNLVDTALVRASGAAAAEVSGGCFCCNLPDFERRLAELSAASAPQVVFAEPVGSCTDLVATITRPLARRGAADRTIGSLTVMADIRLLRRRLQGAPIPFSSDVLYIFDTQLEEADLVILNKSDLVPPEVAENVLALAVSRFPGKHVILQDSRDPRSVDRWLALIGDNVSSPPRSAAVDYERYAAGETRLAWYDASMVMDTREEEATGAVRILMEEIRTAAREAKGPAAHIKLLVAHRGGVFKGSITAAGDALPEIPSIEGSRLKVIINARAETRAEDLLSAMRAALERSARRGAGVRVTEEQSFHPSRPVPSERVP